MFHDSTVETGRIELGAILAPEQRRYAILMPRKVQQSLTTLEIPEYELPRKITRNERPVIWRKDDVSHLFIMCFELPYDLPVLE